MFQTVASKLCQTCEETLSERHEPAEQQDLSPLNECLKKSSSLIMLNLMNKSLDATFQCEHRDELSMPVSMRGLIKGRRDCIVCERMAPLNRVQSTPPQAPTISEILLVPKYYSTTLAVLLKVTASKSKSKSKSDQICNCMQ